MIIKMFHSDGRPDLGRWLVTCDIDYCQKTTLLIHSVDWLVPMQDDDMPSFCPGCLFNYAACLLTTALRCPKCGDSDIRFWYDDQEPDPSRSVYAQCEGCGASLWSYTAEAQLEGLIDGWDIPAGDGWSP